MIRRTRKPVSRQSRRFESRDLFNSRRIRRKINEGYSISFDESVKQGDRYFWRFCEALDQELESNGLKSEISVHDYGRAVIKLSLEGKVSKKFELELNGTRGESFGDYFRIMDADNDSDFVDFNGDIYSIKDVKPIANYLVDWMNDLDDEDDDRW